MIVELSIYPPEPGDVFAPDALADQVGRTVAVVIEPIDGAREDRRTDALVVAARVVEGGTHGVLAVDVPMTIPGVPTLAGHRFID